MSAIYTIFTSPDHPPVPDHLPTLIVTPSGKPAQILYTYLHTNYNRENYLLTPSPQGDLCVAKLFPPPIASTRPTGGKSVSEGGHGSAGSGSRTVKCEASRNFKWSITNSGVLTPSYKCTLPAEDLPGGVSDEQPLFQISKTNPQSPFWTMWYYAYAGHLIPPKRIQFGHISKNIGPDGKPITGGGTRVTITGKSEDEKAVWKTLGEGNEDMVEWAVICAALHVLDDEIVKAAESAGIRIGVMPGARTAPNNRATPPPSAMPRPVLHPTGLKADRPPQAPAPPAGVIPSARGPPPPKPQQQQQPPQPQQQQARMPMPPQQQPQMQQQRPPPSPSQGQFNRGPPPQQPPPQQQPLQQRPMMQQNGDPRMRPPPQPQPSQGPPPSQQPHYSHNLPQPQQQQQGFPPRQAQQSMPPGSSMSPPMQGMPLPDPRQRLGSKSGPRPVFSPNPDQQHPSPQMHHSSLPPTNGMRGPLPPPQQPNGNVPWSPPAQHPAQLPLHNMGNRPPPHAQQNYPMQSNGQPMPPNSSRMGGGLHAPGPGPMSPTNGMPPPRSAPPMSISAMRNRSPLPAPGTSAPEQRMQPPMNGSSRGQPLPGPGRSAPPPELSEEDTVDSVAFMLGATALNDAADRRR